MDLPPTIHLSEAVIDRVARLIIEWDEYERGKIWIDNGTTKYFYTGDDARLVWDFYHPEKPQNWKD